MRRRKSWRWSKDLMSVARATSSAGNQPAARNSSRMRRSAEGPTQCPVVTSIPGHVTRNSSRTPSGTALERPTLAVLVLVLAPGSSGSGASVTRMSRCATTAGATPHHGRRSRHAAGGTPNTVCERVEERRFTRFVLPVATSECDERRLAVWRNVRDVVISGGGLGIDASGGVRERFKRREARGVPRERNVADDLRLRREGGEEVVVVGEGRSGERSAANSAGRSGCRKSSGCSRRLIDGRGS